MTINETILKQELRNLGESLIRISEGIILNDKQEEAKPLVTKKEEKKVAKEEKAPIKEVKQPTEVEETEGNIDLESLSYNELRNLAKERGIKATGSKKDIIARLSGEEAPTPTKEAKKEESVEAKEPTVETVQDTETEEEYEPERTKADEVAEMLEEYSDTEIADILVSVGISPKGKRQALLDKVVEAIDKGLLSFEDDDEEEEEEEPQNEPQEETKEQEPDPEVNEREFLLSCDTQVRKEALEEVKEQVKDMIKDGSYSPEEIDEALESFYLPSEGYDKNLSSEEKEEMLIEMYQRLTDDEGDMHDMDEAYYVNDELCCCGHLAVSEDGKEYYCQVSGKKIEEN